jgi:hypothetical protein
MFLTFWLLSSLHAARQCTTGTGRGYIRTHTASLPLPTPRVQMPRFQFSISTLLLATAAAATWLWVVLLFPGGKGAGLRVIPVAALVLLTIVLHRITKPHGPSAWVVAALWAGITILGAAALASLHDEKPMLFPFR